MANNQDDYDDIPSIVPERDELVSHRKRKRVHSSTASNQIKEVAPAGTSGFVTFILSILFLGLCATGAAGYYFYMQGEAGKASLAEATNRILLLENRLSMVNEATEQQSLGLLQKVDTNFSEIDKLWAARNSMRTELTDTGNTVKELKAADTTIQSAITSQGSMLAQYNTQIAAIQTRIEQINKNFAGMDNLGQQLTVLNADLNRVKTAMDTVEKDVESRLQTAEQDIESINVYRLQTNQTISTVQDSINRLQQRVGQ